jgi:ketosteroid isomerase-like protein
MTLDQGTLSERARAFRSLLEQGRTLDAIEQFYAEDVCVFENRELARAGRAACLAHERESLLALIAPPEFRFRAWAVDEVTRVSFMEYVVRFRGRDGRPMRLEQIAVQQWHAGLVAEERFYFNGVVDEGD